MNNRYIQRITIDWNRVSKESYLRGIPSISRLQELDFHRNITFFAGENGSGKLTLLEAIAVAYGFNAEGGCPITQRNSKFNDNIRNNGILPQGAWDFHTRGTPYLSFDDLDRLLRQIVIANDF